MEGRIQNRKASLSVLNSAFRLLFSAFCLLTSVFCLLSFSLRAEIVDPVRIESGALSGASGSRSGVRVFKGIPFAAPPVGPLRWRAPQPVASWNGVRRADTFGPVCMQPPGVGRLNVSVDLPDSPAPSEDCLYLNVWTAATSSTERRPVMVWIFGGAYTEGAGSSPHNDGEALARKGVVAVTVNYRLGPFGFLAHPALTTESGRNASGNYAMMDLIAALRWVQKNVGAFGGDASNVTIFGESAGAALAAGLVGSPEATGLFQRAISQSGAWMGLSMAPMPMRVSAEEAGVKGAAALKAESLADLRALSALEVQKGLRGAGMIVDGWIVPEDLSITFAQGRQHAVDVLVGSNKDEGSFLLRGPTAEQWTGRVRSRWGDLADQYLKLYPAGSDAEAARSSEEAFRDEMFWHMRLFAEAQAKRGIKSFLYYFTHEPPTDPGKPNLRAAHTAEIPYVFNNLAPVRVFPDGSSPALASASPRDRALADTISSYWVNFARRGDPNGNGLNTWTAFRDKVSSRPMILDDSVDGQRAPDAAKLDLYDAIYAKLLTGLQQ
ncbi:MAG: carboxylesterase/lipase family protein [Vicinamibacterales bacterium]